MEARAPRGRVGWALVAGAVAAVLAAGIAFDLGPFAEEESSRGQFIAAGDEVCRRAHDAFVDLQRQPPQTPEQAAELTGKLIDIAEDESDEISSLRPPAELVVPVERYLEARERGIEALRRGRDAASKRDTAAYESAQGDLADAQIERARMASRIGFSECSRPIGRRETIEAGRGSSSP